MLDRKRPVKIIIAILLLAGSISAKPIIDFEQAATAIYRHENSTKFPYGAEHRVNGRLQGYPPAQARQICIRLCRKAYENWDGRGNYFQALNKIYAADSRWYRSVEKIYNQQQQIKHTKQNGK